MDNLSIWEQCVVYSVYCHWEYYSSKEKEPIFAKRAAKKKAARKRRPLHLLFFSPDTQVSGRLAKIRKVALLKVHKLGKHTWNTIWHN